MRASETLLDWFDGERRDLPWRGTRDPYRIWVSEIMLQQTRVETALPYYRRFLERFPDVASLARSEIDEVLGLWSGLGYYGRARRMHQAARLIVARGGGFPTTPEDLRELPGVGEYTAAAVASIAFDAVVPVLDGNVVRVTSRLIAFEEDPRKAAGRRRLLECAAGLLDRERPGDSNQALMELGATVCLPRNPDCVRCPLEKVCAARIGGDPEEYPRPRERRSPVRLRRVSAVVEEGDKIFLVRRPPGSEVLPGAWEVPWVEWAETAPAERRLAESYGGSWRLGDSLGRVRHAITFRSFEVDVRGARLAASDAVAESVEAGWFRRDEIERLHFSSLLMKILDKAGFAAPRSQP